ncbi:hypothetical protein ACOMHN_056880 [Nucella lapillus]
MDFNDMAVLSFDVKLYQNGTVNLPYNTYLHQSRVTLYGGVLQGVHTLNLSLGGVFTIYPPARLNASGGQQGAKELRLNSMVILDGGRFEFTGLTHSHDTLSVVLEGGLVVHGGGVMTGNNIHVSAVNITVEAEGLINARGRGWKAGGGPSPGVPSDAGGSGGSHGGLGGRGTGTMHARAAYDDTRHPVGAGSGGSVMSSGAVSRGVGGGVITLRASHLMEVDGTVDVFCVVFLTVQMSSGAVSGGVGGGVITLRASHLMEVDGTVDASGTDASTVGGGGAAGGTVVAVAPHVAGKGVMRASGGGGACVPHCAVCDAERRCLACAPHYSLVRQACITEGCRRNYPACCHGDPYCRQSRGGGGGGGRVSVTATTTYTYCGTYQTFGGRSQSEAGGSGTTFLSHPQGETTLMVDNQGRQPVTAFVANMSADSARTYVVVSDAERFSHARVLGGAHLVFRKKDNSVVNASVTIDMIEGDNSGMVHSSQEMRVTVTDGAQPFPTSLRIYDQSVMDLPQVMRMERLAYKTVHINGLVSGMQSLTIGQGVTVLLGSLGGMEGAGRRRYNLDSLQIWADGVLSADYVDELSSSLTLNVTTSLRLHAGSKITAPWIRVKASHIQVDAAALIDTSGTSPPTLQHNGVDNPSGGGSGGGSAAAGGQGRYTRLSGPTTRDGSMYEPHHYGGNGGEGGGASVDSLCSPRAKHTGGRGGGVIQLEALDLRVDGQLLSEGRAGSGSRAGGGAGGSILIRCSGFRGDGVLSVRGGSVAPAPTSCRGGGGGGGRVAVYYSTNRFQGDALAQGGGQGHECGGSGTVVWRDVNQTGFELVVDNRGLCQPLDPAINFGVLSDTHRGEHSFHTWLYDPAQGHRHEFKAVTINGSAQMALHRRNIDDFTQTMLIHRTEGDKSGWLHLGPQQVLRAELPRASPQLQFSVRSYPGATMQADRTLTVQDVMLDLEGVLAGVDTLIVAPHGDVILRPHGNSSSSLQREVQFGTIHVQGGGRLRVVSEERGLRLTGRHLRVDSGGVVQLDRGEVVVGQLTVHDSALITATGQSTLGGAGLGEFGGGGGHGGQGGVGNGQKGGLFYDSVTLPSLPGSTSRKDDVIVRGGGYINITANITRLDGYVNITANTTRLDGYVNTTRLDGE